jgi:hypothetical protein
MNDPILFPKPPNLEQPSPEGLAAVPCSPVSDTPETDALLEPLRGSCAFNGPCAEHARRLERERNAARIPICIGRPIIEILAKEGMWTSMNGNSVVAADCLFGRNPYQENKQISHQ